MIINASIEPRLTAQLSCHKVLRGRLLGEIPDLDAETLADTLEGLTDLKEMLAELVRSALEDEALAAGLSTRLSDMKARLERFETRAKRKSQLALKTMSEPTWPNSSSPTSPLRCGNQRQPLRWWPKTKYPPPTGNRSRSSSIGKVF